ncbi:hypothetical protein BHE90_004031 [Fusarium euwallaceae]|uniref:Uncharacterized protein n=1 Tax=Fusarium euwallaceae TaxID=1147111 RepID=A0A430M0H2_9HYPO|nr:hypothetical protein BHE90_004031 [Fusarium euwallaceae]
MSRPDTQAEWSSTRAAARKVLSFETGIETSWLASFSSNSQVKTFLWSLGIIQLLSACEVFTSLYPTTTNGPVSLPSSCGSIDSNSTIKANRPLDS